MARIYGLTVKILFIGDDTGVDRGFKEDSEVLHLSGESTKGP